MPDTEFEKTNEHDKHHFGYQKVSALEKTQKVFDVFASVAQKYDVMNDVMSWGMHRCWKDYLVSCMHIKQDDDVLDAAGGTADVTRRLARRIRTGSVTLLDMNDAMLRCGRDASINQGVLKGVHYIQGNLETLPFASATFDKISIAFGLRNVTHMDKALFECHRILKPGGALYVLEFSKPKPYLEPLYDWYSFKLLPFLGKKIAGDEASYQYLAESIRMHPAQSALRARLEAAQFEDVSYENLALGVVALHRGYKY